MFLFALSSFSYGSLLKETANLFKSSFSFIHGSMINSSSSSSSGSIGSTEDPALTVKVLLLAHLPSVA